MRSAILFALLPSLALAQSPTPHPGDLGTVTGHITCADTQRPARNAQVSLIATKTPIGYDAEHEVPFSQQGGEGPVHTDLTGGYIIADVPPGQYYLSVELAGYATPISQFTPDELHAPTPEIKQRIQSDFQLVTVTPNSAVRADATIPRAGSISGTVIWDDGSPAIDTDIRILRHDAKNNRHDIVPKMPDTATDGHGQFTVESLLPGEYLVVAVLKANERRLSQITFPDGTKRDFLSEQPTLFMPVYSPGVFRDKDAAIIKVDAGQETNGADVTMPVGRLHEVSGTLLSQDGHVISDGRVQLLFVDTEEEFTGVYVHDNGIFHFPYVPDGSYILKVTSARDITLDEVPDSSALGSPTHTNRRATHTYGNLQRPLTVQSSDQSLSLTLPDKPTRATTDKSTGTN